MKKILFSLISLLLFIGLNSCGQTEEEKLVDQVGKIVDTGEQLDNNMLDNGIDKMTEEDIPSWVEDLGFSVSGLEFDEDKSEITKKDSLAGFDSVNITYYGDNYDKVIEQAEKLSENMDVPESDISIRKNMNSVSDMMGGMGMSEDEMAEMQANMDENMRGAMFMNCTLGIDCKKEDEFAKLISVGEDGENWEIKVSIVNLEQWQEQMDKHNKFTQ